MITPSAPPRNALTTNIGSTRLEHITRITLNEGGICSLLTPAKSAPAYEHQLQRKATILGSNSLATFLSPNRCRINS